MEKGGINRQMCVIIPVHKSNLSVDDEISLRACSEHLRSYDCYLVFPKGMDTNNYLSINPELLLKPVDPEWLSSIENYNRMKVDISFYEMFINYQFMMTYELDAYIFTSEFHNYEIFDYDYIGAPLFEGYLEALPNALYIGGLNSGFSVRNIQTCVYILNKLKNYKLHWLLYEKVISRLPKRVYNALVHRINKLTKNRYEILLNGQLSFYFKRKPIWEDIVWSVIIPSLFPSFKVANPAAALKFSFEALPKRLYMENNCKLPLGCHGWPKNKQFWKRHIPINEII